MQQSRETSERELLDTICNEEITMVVFKVFKNQFQQFITTHISMDYDDEMTNKFFTEYTLCDAQVFQNILISKMDSIEKAIVERGLYKRARDRRENERMMQTQEKMINMVKDKCDVGLVVNERSGTQSEKQNESSRSRNDTRAEGVDIRLSIEPEPMNEVQSTAAYNVFANDRQHAEEPKLINKGGVDQDVVQRLNKRPLLAFIIENKMIESLNQTLEYENDYLKKTIAKLQNDFSKLKAQMQTQSSNVTQNEKENLRSTLSEFAIDHILGKDDSSSSSIAESHISKLEKESGENICENAKCELQTKIVELEKILTEQTKDFDDVKLELTQLENLKGKSMETKFDKPSILRKPPADKLLLLKRIASLVSKLASQDLRSCQKEYHELRTSYNALKADFDSFNWTKRKNKVFNLSKPKVSVSETVHTGEYSKPFSKRVSQFTTYSFQKDRKSSKKSQVFETPTSQNVFMKSASNAKNQVFETPHSRFTPVKQVWRPKQSRSNSLKYSKSEMLSMQNKNASALKRKNNGRFSKVSKMNYRKDTPNVNNKWKSSSSTRFKTPHETLSFNNQWKIKRNFKSLLIPRELFSNETPVSSPR
ncbi:hypothetical protein Tco_1001710 [Tanacetum coccineum]